VRLTQRKALGSQRPYELSTAARFGAQLLVRTWSAISAIPSSGTVHAVVCPPIDRRFPKIQPV